MAPGAAAVSVQTSPETPSDAPKRTSVKALSESSGLAAVPSDYSYSESAASEVDKNSIPVIDFSLLTSSDPEQRSRAIQDLDKASQEWGFFLLVNHGVSESLMKAVISGCDGFFNLMLEEKQAFSGRNVWDPIRFGTGVDVKVEQFYFWRDFIKFFVHPEFHCPAKPQGLSEVVREYSIKTRAIVLELLKGLSVAMGQGESYIEKAMNMDRSFQVFAANLYPPCPQPELAMGIPAHTDHGLLTLLFENSVSGLEIQHNGGWYNVHPLPNSFVVNIADQLEVFSNGRYKSIWHRAAVNSHTTRMSIPSPHGPSLDTVVAPAPELVDGEGRPAAYKPMKYKDYMDMLSEGRPCLERVRLAVAEAN